jgi:hypothetical protein
VSGYNFSLIIIAIFLTISMFQNNDYWNKVYFVVKYYE